MVGPQGPRSHRSMRVGDRVEKRYGGGGKATASIAAFERAMTNHRLVGIEDRKANAERPERIAAKLRTWLAGINAAVGGGSRRGGVASTVARHR